jgi:hypothetical protein
VSKIATGSESFKAAPGIVRPNGRDSACCGGDPKEWRGAPRYGTKEAAACGNMEEGGKTTRDVHELEMNSDLMRMRDSCKIKEIDSTLLQCVS